ncbi:MAG: penicillin-binding protein activator, partial [Sandaracinobacteroides sp.]
MGLLAGLAMVAGCAPRARAPVAPIAPPPLEKPAEVKPGEAHRVAILVPLTGPNAPVGISLANAATLALVDTGKQGVRLTSY